MKLHFYVLTILLGVVATVHLGMNGKVGVAMNNARVANAVFWVIGTVAAVIIAATGWKSGALHPMRDVHPLLWTAGVLGASLVFGIVWLIPRVGAGPTAFVMLIGQLISALILSHFGWLGSPVDPITFRKIAGLAVVIAGVLLTTR